MHEIFIQQRAKSERIIKTPLQFTRFKLSPNSHASVNQGLII